MDDTLHRLSRLLRRAPGWSSPTLLESLEGQYLVPLIDARVRHLASEGRSGGRRDDDIRKDVSDGYRKALQARLASPFLPERPQLQAVSMQIGQVIGDERLRCARPLGSSVLEHRQAFARWLRGARPPGSRWRDEWRSAEIARWPPELVASAILTAVQQLAFERVLRDYRVDRALPAEVRAALSELITRTCAAALVLRATPPLPTLSQWQQRIELAEAGLAGRILLPLKAISSAPLRFGPDDVAYSAATDQQAQRLARQFRHADGVVLVTGYRGVGKTSFVNRALHLATARQEQLGDDWIVVPVVVSVAKSSGVSSVLRVTLRAIRDALLGADGTAPVTIPGGSRTTLPLQDDERELLDWAYLRATWKVALSRTAEDQSEWGVSTQLGLDPGKWLAAIAPQGRAWAQRSRQNKLRRELSLLDYDEDAAEADISRLIERLARPRSAADPRRIRPVIVFDELDKLDFDTGVKPLLDGLKNLFLRPHAVFVLVTSKKMYYELRDQRAVEDASLSSYFSAVVHVPLLEAAQVREQLEGWIDRELWTSTSPRQAAAEAATVERLARCLTYKSLGNPRDLIRELRQLQQFIAAGASPLLGDDVLRAPAVAVYAAVQQAVEATGVPWRNETDPTAGSATRATERAGADEARLEQLRRGLYVLVETAIDRQTLILDDKTLEPIRTANLSLYTSADARELATQLARQLEAIDTRSSDVGGAEPWFKLIAPAKGSKAAAQLVVTAAFYRLTGRRAAAVDASEELEAAAAPGTARLAQEVEELFAHGGRAERMLAISQCGRLAPDDIGEAMKAQLRQVLIDDGPDFRRRVIAALPLPVLLDASLGLADAAAREGHAAAWTAALARMSEVEPDSPLRSAAVEVLRRLIGCHGEPAQQRLARISMGSDLIADPALLQMGDALRALARLAQTDLSGELLAWLRGRFFTRFDVQRDAIDAAIAIAQRFDADLLPQVYGDSRLLAVIGVARALIERRDAIVGRRHAFAIELLLRADDGEGPRELLVAEIKAAQAAGDAQAASLIVDRLLAPVPAEGAEAAVKLLESALARAEVESKALAWIDTEVARRRDSGALSPADLDGVQARLKRVSERKPLMSPGFVGLGRHLGWPTGGSWRVPDLAVAPAGAPRWPGLAESLSPPSAWTTPDPVFEPDRWTLLLTLGAIALLIVCCLIPDGWPASSDLLWRRLGSRAALLAFPLLLAVMAWDIEGQPIDSLASSSKSALSNQAWASQAKFALVMLVLLGVDQAHKEWIGPWESWPVLLTAAPVSFGAVVLGYIALRRTLYPQGRLKYRVPRLI